MAAGTPTVRLSVNDKHYYNLGITERTPALLRSFRIVTTDMTDARTVTLGLYYAGVRVQIYDVTPNLDNNTIELSTYYKVEDGATASTTVATGSTEKGYKITGRTELRLDWSGAISAGDTSTWYITYEAYEPLDWVDTAGLTTENRHVDLGQVN